MKVKITPLNFATAFFLIAAVYIWVNGAGIAGMQYKRMGGAIGWVFLLFAFVVSFLDITFRNFFPQTKNLWVIELSFITLTAIIFLLIK
jgi:NADH:ubiquinone oxidoreductase subunit 6 (subunit J)